MEPLSVHGSKIVFAKVLAHELIHYLSFISVRASENDDQTIKARTHINGLDILKYEDEGVRVYFNVVDEALTMYISNMS